MALPSPRSPVAPPKNPRRSDESPLMGSRGVADIVNMPDQTVEERGAPQAPGSAAAANEERARTHRPASLRVAATLVADTIALIGSSILAVWVALELHPLPLLDALNGSFDARPGALLLVALTPYWLAALWAFGLYREPGRSIGGFNLAESLNGLTALTSASWLLLIALVLLYGPEAPIGMLIVFWAFAAVLVPLARWIGRASIWARPSFQERVLIIGAGEVGHTVAAKIAGHPEYRIDLVGYLDDGEPRHNGREGPPLPVIGALGDLDAIVAGQQVDRVIVAFSRARHNDFLRIVRACADSGVRVNIVPRLFEVVSSRALVDDVEGIPLLDVGHVELSRFNMAVKRAFDLVVGGLLCLPVLPFMGIVALVIKLDSPGPVFFRQERMGRGGKPFHIFKFRSMHVGADEERLELAEARTTTTARCSSSGQTRASPASAARCAAGASTSCRRSST